MRFSWKYLPVLFLGLPLLSESQNYALVKGFMHAASFRMVWNPHFKKKVGCGMQHLKILALTK